MNRRSFIKSLAAVGAMPLLPACFSSKAYLANSKVRMAFVGIGCQGWYDMQQFGLFPALFETVALCDTDMGAKHTQNAIKAYPRAARFTDFRRMFDKMGDQIDAVMVAIPDHSHFAVAMEAMRRGKAVYVEKPLAHTFEECELLRLAEKKYGVVTQMGNQGHSTVKYHQFKHYVETGVVKDVERVVAHMNNARRWHKWNGKVEKLPGPDKMPATLDWNSWLSSVEDHAYAEEYMMGEWRAWYDFGSGCMGDWGAHLIDCVHQFLLKGDLPTEVNVVNQTGWNRFVYPMSSTLNFKFAANSLHDDFELDWYEGAKNLPPLPHGFVWDNAWGDIPKSSANEDVPPSLHPGKEMYQRDGKVWQSLSHKHPLHVVGDYGRKLPDYPPEFCTHYEGFLRAVRGEMQTLSPFSVAAPLSQIFTLACLAQRLNRSFRFDPVEKRVIGDKQADAMLRNAPRKGWEEYYKV